MSHKKIRALIEMMQRNLSALSIDYLKKEMSLLSASPINQVAQEIIQKGIQMDKIGRRCAPCFYTLESLLQRMIDKNHCLLIDVTRWNLTGKKIDHLKMFYEPDAKNLSFRCIEPSETNRSLPVIALVGNSIREDQEQLSSEEYRRLFQSHRLEDVLNANWAQHAQYPDGVKLEALPEDARHSQLVARASTLGCTPENMSLFLVYHIFCDRLEDALMNQEML